jgi:hypothetical protein
VKQKKESRKLKQKEKKVKLDSLKQELPKMSATALSAAPPPNDALPPTTNNNHLPLLHSDGSEKPSSHASSLAGQKDADDAAAAAAAAAIKTTTTPSSSKPGIFSRRWALEPVVKDYGDYGLLACSFVTGMVDGASFLNWGVFVGMQTGEFFLCYFFFFLTLLFLGMM